MRRGIPRRALVALFGALVLCSIKCAAKEAWFDQRITWKYGTEGLPWTTILKNPDGPTEYQLILRPLWALEGGVIALEIVVARPAQPEVNLLGERENGVEYPFVITVEELKKGVKKSKFGAVRNFQVDNLSVRVKIEGSRLGRGVGSLSTYCAKCPNLQELSLQISVGRQDP